MKKLLELMEVVVKVKANGNDDLNRKKVCSPETTGHKDNIVSQRIGNVEVTFYKLNDGSERCGVEVYHYKSGTWDIKYSRNYPLKKVPRKYRKLVKELMIFHKKCFS